MWTAIRSRPRPLRRYCLNHADLHAAEQYRCRGADSEGSGPSHIRKPASCRPNAKANLTLEADVPREGPSGVSPPMTWHVLYADGTRAMVRGARSGAR